MFVRNMLASKIMRSCIIMLMGDASNPNEEDIEALCKLLETVGQSLDKPTDPKLGSQAAVHTQHTHTHGHNTYDTSQTLSTPHNQQHPPALSPLFLCI